MIKRRMSSEERNQIFWVTVIVITAILFLWLVILTPDPQYALTDGMSRPNSQGAHP